MLEDSENPKVQPFHIRVFVEGIDIEVNIKADDPCDVVMVAGRVVDVLRLKGYLVKVEVKP